MKSQGETTKKVDKIVKVTKDFISSGIGLKKLKSISSIDDYDVIVKNKVQNKTYLIDSSLLGGSGIQTIAEGTNITVDNTDPLNPIISASGGGSSALFPNGIEIVSESRYFQASDAGKRLFVSGENTVISMPEVNPFAVGDYVGIINDGDNISFTTEYGGEPIFSLKTGDGTTSECVILMNTEIEGSSWLFPISTSFKYDNTDSKKKTALRYLYEKQQSSNEQIITLGTVTFNDINAAPAISEISIPLNVIPSDYYAVLFFCEITAAFDFPSMGYVKAISGPFGDLTRDFTSIGKTVFSESSGFNIGGTLSANTINSIFNFDAGSGQVNPKNLTTGSATIKALIKKFPN